MINVSIGIKSSYTIVCDEQQFSLLMRFLRVPNLLAWIRKGAQVSSTEIFKSQEGGWRVGPEYHRPVYGHSVVQYSSDVILVVGGANAYGGQGSREIYSLSKTNLGGWTYLGRTSEPRYAHIAIMIPKDFAPYCELEYENIEDED